MCVRVLGCFSSQFLYFNNDVKTGKGVDLAKLVVGIVSKRRANLNSHYTNHSSSMWHYCVFLVMDVMFSEKYGSMSN